MNTFLAVVNAVNAVLAAKPAVQSLVDSTKEWIGSLFSAGVITKEQQDTLFAWCDDHMNATLRGEVHPALVVD